MEKVIVAVLALFTLVGCSDPRPYEQVVTVNRVPSAELPRVNVEIIGRFTDPLAYRDVRGIYVVTDRKTGKEYIGISGVGITEAGTSTVGKMTNEIER